MCAVRDCNTDIGQTGQETDALSDQTSKLSEQASKIQSEMKACMSLASASAEGMAKLQTSMDRLDADGISGGSELPADAAERLGKMESILDELSGLGELRTQIDEHSTKLAEIFTGKASKDDLDAMKSSMKGLGDTFAGQLQKQVADMVRNFA